MERGSSKKSSRSYHECPICKHGFTTGQALGGHMNIHRRDVDRASSRRDVTPAAAAGTVVSATSSLAYPPSQPTTGGSFAAYYYYPCAVSFGGASNQRELNQGSRVSGDHQAGQPDGEAETGLDLELRLGRHPGWQ